MKGDREMDERKISTRDIAGATEEREDRDIRHDEGVRPVAAVEGGREGVASREPSEPLFPTEEAHGYRTRWDAVQTGFVDEPRKAVEEADSLVADVMKRLAGAFAEERTTLEQQWSRGDQVSTEELRVALRRYRTFFQRLLDV
jgi:hypothetical protein